MVHRGPVVFKIPPTDIPLAEIERQADIEALSMSNWVQNDTTKLLSISPRVMNYKIELPRGRGSSSFRSSDPTRGSYALG